MRILSLNNVLETVIKVIMIKQDLLKQGFFLVISKSCGEVVAFNTMLL